MEALQQTAANNVTHALLISRKIIQEKMKVVWNVEQILLDKIRNGDLQYQNVLSLAMSSSSGVGIMTGNPLRQAKDSGIVFCALCARAAIEGGLSAAMQ